MIRGLKEPLRGTFNVSGFKVIYNPVALIKALEKYNMQKRVDTIHASSLPKGVIGGFNTINGQIIVDIYEIIEMLRFHGTDAIDKQLTQTLFHELRHREQFNQHGMFSLYWDKFVIMILVNVFFLKILTLGLWQHFWQEITEQSIFVGLIVGVIALIVTLLGLVISGLISYYLSWVERDARSFAKKIIQDPVSDDVFKVH